MWDKEGILFDTNGKEWTKTCDVGKKLKIAASIEYRDGHGMCGGEVDQHVKIWLDETLIVSTKFSDICASMNAVRNITYDDGRLTLTGPVMLNKFELPAHIKDDIVQVNTTISYHLDKVSEKELPLSEVQLKNAAEKTLKEDPNVLDYAFERWQN